MQVTRMDLDGVGSPAALVTKILRAEPNLTAPIPIVELARRLDIADIREVETEGFEGGLITDSTRSFGFILVNKRTQKGRRRFTIAHELGHFLMTHHKPPDDGFRCSRADMRRWDAKEKNAAARFEVEANEFASLLLMPPPLWRRALSTFRQPDLSQVVQLAGDFEVSKEAAARSYALYHDEPIAIVVAKDGVINKIYRKATGFPAFCVWNGSPVPHCSALFRRGAGQTSEFLETRAEQWLQSDWGKPLPSLSEQVLFQREGFALVMLWAEFPEEEEGDPDEDKTAKQRLQDRQARWQGR